MMDSTNNFPRNRKGPFKVEPLNLKTESNMNCDGKPKSLTFSLKPLSVLEWITVYGIYCVTMFLLVYFSLNSLPLPQSKNNANKENFLEEIARFYRGWLWSDMTTPLFRVHLNEIVGFGQRPSGSEANEVDAVNYIFNAVKDIEKHAASNVKFQIDIQHPTGSFALAFLGGFGSYYSNVTNTIVKISPVNGATKPALLLNCHTDSVAGVPGASDDAVACAVLLEVMRALVVEHRQPLLCPVIFLFNGAEENILQASHGFITQHPWAKEIGAFINLEAAGAGGKEVVFQTGPSNPWLAMTWSAHAPHPFGSIVAQELYQMGVIPAETDFRIFRDFGHIPGIDLAYIKNGYVYHTIYDNVDMIQPGSVQRAGDNILAVVRHLVKSKKSLLPNPSIYRHGATTFLDILGIYMIIIPFRLVTILNWVCSVGGMLFLVRRIVFAKDPGFSMYGKQLMKAVATIILTWVSCFVTILVISTLLTMLGRTMTFLSHPSLVTLLFAVPGFLSMLMVHWLVKVRMFAKENHWKLESIFFDAYLFLWCVVLFQLNYLQIHSSLLLLLGVAPVLLVRCLLFKNVFSFESDATSRTRLWVYLLAAFPHSLVMMTHAVFTMEFFIPLLTRLGSVAPPDVVIGIIAAVFVCVFTHFSLSMVHAVKSFQKCFLPLFLLFVFGLLFAFSQYGFPYSYSPAHPITKRLFIQHTEREFYNQDGKLTHSNSGLWINPMDYPGFSLDMGCESIHAAPPAPCVGAYCHFPWMIPLQDMIRVSKYLPAEKPSQLSVITNPLNVKITGNEMKLIQENATTRMYKKRLSFSISGPSHMSIQIGTFKSKKHFSQMTKWSINGPLEDVINAPNSEPSVKHTEYNEWHFVYYGAGLNPLPWQPWFEFLVFRDKDQEQQKSQSFLPSVEFGFSSQHFPTDRNIPTRGQTAAIRSIISQVEDWVMPIGWVSTYKNFLF